MKRQTFYKVTVRPTSCEEEWFTYFSAKPSFRDVMKVVYRDRELANVDAANLRVSMEWVCKRLKLTEAVENIVANFLPSVKSQKIFVVGVEVAVVKVEKLLGHNNT